MYFVLADVHGGRALMRACRGRVAKFARTRSRGDWRGLMHGRPPLMSDRRVFSSCKLHPSQ